jgi:2-(3-amino-3-carboxypropyl)histidine synthase
MEEDRAIADLGPELPIDLDGEDETAAKTPKRRFIGRRAADAKALAKGGAQANGNGTIEDSGAVQGADYTYKTQHHNGTTSSCLVQLLPAAALPVL